MAAGAPLLSGRIDYIAENPVDPLDAVYQTGVLEKLEITVDGYAIEVFENVNELAMGKGATGAQDGGENVEPYPRGSQARLF